MMMMMRVARIARPIGCRFFSRCVIGRSGVRPTPVARMYSQTGNVRWFSEDVSIPKNYEQEIEMKLLEHFPGAYDVKVTDQSGGCGASFLIEITAPQFKDKNMLQQQRMVNACLKEDIAKWHAVNYKTKVAKEEE